MRKVLVMGSIPVFRVGELYSSDQIQCSLGVGNAGGVRVATDGGQVRWMVVMTSVASARQATENPYHDRIEGDFLVYTGAGRRGDQTLAGVNQRIPQQQAYPFPAYAFLLIGSRRDKEIGSRRWRFLGLLQYIRHYPETQIDIHLKERRVWVFEFRIHTSVSEIPISYDLELSQKLLATASDSDFDQENDRKLGDTSLARSERDHVQVLAIESVRRSLLGLSGEQFEHVVKDTLVTVGFERVVVTQYSQDGGIDVNAHAGQALWPIKDLLVQAQAKRWLHTVGRKEVAELRGSLQPHARGLVVTTSHFSRAAMTEAAERGKLPIVLMDGYSFASIVHDRKVHLPELQ